MLRLAAPAALALLSLLAVSARGQGSEELDRFIELKMQAAHVPGLAAAIVRDSEVWWARGYGMANIQAGLPVTADTPFMLASVSKTFTGTALMQLLEDGLAGLDDDVDDYLPFSVRSPSWPGVPVTFRHLLAHVSGIQDNWGVMTSLYVAGDSSLPLGVFLQGYFDREGAWYEPGQNWTGKAPGTAFEYSNIGFALVGYLVERLAGIPFDDRCDQNVFGALGMTRTGWHLADFDPAEVAMPYQYQYGQGTWTPYGQYGYPDYPNGQLRSSVTDVARFLVATIDFGRYPAGSGMAQMRPGGASPTFQLLEARTAASMRVVQYPSLDAQQCLAFYHWIPGAGNPGGETRLGHSGGDQGVFTEMWFRPGDGVGVVLLANGDALQWAELLKLLDVVDRLFEEAGPAPAASAAPRGPAVPLGRWLAPRIPHGGPR